MANQEYLHTRDGETPAAAAPTAASPAPNNHPTSSSPPGNNQNHPSQPMNAPDTSVPPANQEVQAFDEFDPRGAVSGMKVYLFFKIGTFFSAVLRVTVSGLILHYLSILKTLHIMLFKQGC